MPHGLRHTFASLLLFAQVSPAYVQRQLGHASIKLTVDTYGRWLPMGNKVAIDGLDDKETTRTVRDQGHTPEVGPESGAPDRDLRAVGEQWGDAENAIKAWSSLLADAIYAYTSGARKP
jgi:hypothetical protein